MLPHGFPILVDEESDLICEPVLLWLYESYYERRQENSKETVWAYANDLKDWFVFLEEIELSWTDATNEDLRKYCGVMRNLSSPTTGLNYATTTINRRRVGIIEFYRWSGMQAHFQIEERQPVHLLHPHCNFLAKLEKTEDDKDHISVLMPHQARELMRQLGPKPSAIKDKFVTKVQQNTCEWTDFLVEETSRDRLHCETALLTGMRISSVSSLKLSHFQRFIGVEISDTTYYSIGGIRRKGGGTWPVYFPGILLKEILLYIEYERAYLFARYGTKSKSLFLNPGKITTRYRGSPTSARTIERAFHNACLRANLRKATVGHKSQSPHGSTEEPLFVYHDLRHTYAVWTYYVRKKTDAAPWMYIQQQLGHKHLSTTTNIYLKVVKEFEHLVSDKYIQELKRVA